MTAKLLPEYHLACLSLKRDCIGSSESTLVLVPHCWKSQVAADKYIYMYKYTEQNFKLVILHFYLSFESKMRVYTIHVYKNQTMSCQNSACHFI